MGILLLAIGERSSQFTKKKMEYFRLTIAFLFCILIQGSFQEENEQRDGKVFSLFSIVTFPNTGCSSQSVTGNKARNGTCYTATECAEKAGTVSGNCAAGFGVCCLFIASAGGSTVTQNCSYIQNPSFPSAYAATTALSYTIAKCAADVCTLRLDFETFTTAGPTGGSDNTAAIDTFQITTTPSTAAIPAISGENSGYHVYVEVENTASATATLAFTFGTSTVSRTWEIKVTQIECTNRARPNTPGCLQYFTGTTGRVETFNYGNTATLQQHLHNQDYNICIRKEAGYNCIRYTACSDASSFQISSTVASTGMLGTMCSLDYITLTGATPCGSTDINHSGKICGLVFNPGMVGSTAALALDAAACSCNAPFSIGVHTNAVGAEIDATTNRGVCLEYTMY